LWLERNGQMGKGVKLIPRPRVSIECESSRPTGQEGGGGVGPAEKKVGRMGGQLESGRERGDGKVYCWEGGRLEIGSPLFGNGIGGERGRQKPFAISIGVKICRSAKKGK